MRESRRNAASQWRNEAGLAIEIRNSKMLGQGSVERTEAPTKRWNFRVHHREGGWPFDHCD